MMHSRTYFLVRMTNVLVVKDLSFNPFSLHWGQRHGRIVRDEQGTHLVDGALTFPFNDNGTYLHANRMAPPTSAFADCVHVSPGPSPAVAAPRSPISGISGSGVETPVSAFPPTAAAAPGVVTSEIGFPPAAADAPGVVTSDFPHTATAAPGVVTSGFGFPPTAADAPGVGPAIGGVAPMTLLYTTL